MSKRWPALLIIGFGILFTLLVLSYAVYLQSIDQTFSAPLPGEISGMPLKGRIAGAPALDELSWMHGQEFMLDRGAVGIYGMGNEITLYVAGTPLSFIAGRMIIYMRDKIAKTDTPFTPLGEREHGQRKVYELVGMEQKHFYFRSRNLVIWLAVDEQEAESALQQALEFYP